MLAQQAMASSVAPVDSIDVLKGHPRYKGVKYINKGSFGFVVLAEDVETKEPVAIKFVLVSSEMDAKHSHREILNHQQLLHPHVVQLRDVLCVPPYLALVMEYVPGGDMFQYVVSRRGLPEAEARWFFQQLVLGMDYCHRKGVMSRDIKLENTLLVLQPDKKPLLKLCDFGYSKHELLDSVAKSKVGTPGYTAPEVITNQRGYDGKAADVWSAGVMLYTMLFARYPFERSEDKKLNANDRLTRVLHRIMKVDYQFPEGAAISDPCRDLISKILVANPTQRLSIAGVAAHPWFRQDLPEGSLEYNDWAMQLAVAPAQAPAQVEALIEQAAAESRKARSKNLGLGDDDLLGSIDLAD